eukprot:PhM_4_TR11692/c3_g1_i4/m.23670
MITTSPPQGFFVYGTLRPDDPREMPWKTGFNQGMDACKAVLRGARLYFQSYPFVLHPDDVANAPSAPEETQHVVVGYVLRCRDGVSFDDKLRDADLIEGYPSYYDRVVIDAHLEDGGTVPAYVYVRRQGVEELRDLPEIPGGDWVKYREHKVV